jgi:hypothetical protein
MTCEDVPARIAWEIQLYEPCTGLWMPRCYGRATTPANPTDVACAALTAYLAITTVWPGQQFRAHAQPDGGPAVTVAAGELPDGWTAGEDVRQALPLYLRDALRLDPFKIHSLPL